MTPVVLLGCNFAKFTKFSPAFGGRSFFPLLFASWTAQITVVFDSASPWTLHQSFLPSPLPFPSWDTLDPGTISVEREHQFSVSMQLTSLPQHVFAVLSCFSFFPPCLHKLFCNWLLHSSSDLLLGGFFFFGVSSSFHQAPFSVLTPRGTRPALEAIFSLSPQIAAPFGFYICLFVPFHLVTHSTWKNLWTRLPHSYH